MNLRNRLLLAMGLLFLLQIVLAGFAVNVLHRNNQAMEEILKDRYVKINSINTIRYELNNISLSLHKASAGGHDPIYEMQKVDDSILEINAVLMYLEPKVDTQPAYNIMALFDAQFDEYQRCVADTKEYIARSQSTALAPALSNQEEALYNQLAKTVEEFRVSQESLMDSALSRSQAASARIMQIMVPFLLVYLLISAGITTWILRSMISNISRVSRIIASAADKSSDMPRIEIDTHDELGVIAAAYNKMAEGIEKFSRAEQETSMYMQGRTWLSSNIAELTTRFQDMQSPVDLGSYFINHICPAVEAPYGVLYLRQKNLNFTRLAAYAAAALPNSPEIIPAEAGLIGQCASQNQQILLEQTPEDYIKISSGLGAAKPAVLLVKPIEYGSRVLGVLELASFKPFGELQQELLDEIVGNLGVALFGLIQQMQVKELLNESQLLNEELRVQAEELQSQAEELQSHHEELKTINEQLETHNLNSDQRRMELESIRNQLQEKNQQLMQASQFKSEFLANISHELRTPLNSILILAEILGQNPEDNLSAKQVEFVNTIYHSGRDLLGLINQVLDLTKIESGKMDVNYTKISPRVWLDQLLNQSNLAADRSAVDFSVEIDPNLPDIIYSDEQHLLHIVNNLLSNAFKFAPHGQVKLCLKKSERLFNADFPTLSKAGTVLEIVVSDNGIGIPADKQEMIFEAFKQADGATNRIYGGSGLGLSICRQTASLLGGVIEVDSKPGQGSTFSVYIPCDAGVLTRQIASSIDTELERQTSDPSAPGFEVLSPTAIGESTCGSQSQQTAELYDMTDKTVLLVDDDMRNVFALTSVLEGKKIRVLFAENGTEALEVLQQNPDLDLIIMDIMMPKMDGYEAITSIRSMPHYQDLPIIALTAKAMKGDRLKCIEVGASDYMNKPVDIEQLLSLISVWLYK